MECAAHAFVLIFLFHACGVAVVTRYYKLDVSYFMSSLAQSTLGTLKNKFLWQNTFSSSPMLEPDHQQRVAERVATVSDKLESHDAFHHLHGASGGSFRSEAGGPAKKASADLGNCAQGGQELAIGQINGCIGQLIKHSLFVDVVAAADTTMDT